MARLCMAHCQRDDVPFNPASLATASTRMLSPGMMMYMFSYTERGA